MRIKGKYLLFIFLTIMTVFVISACDENDDQTVIDDAKVALNPILDEDDTLANITEDLELPTSIGDVTISWESSHPDVVSSTGIVTRGTEDVEATLTATLTYNSLELEKSFTVTVTALDVVATPQDALDDISLTGDSLTYDDELEAFVTEDDIVLPNTSLDYEIAWSSNNVAVITDEGLVQRPSYAEDDETVELTATIETESKVFTIIVKAITEKPVGVSLDEALELVVLDNIEPGITEDLVLPLAIGDDGVTVSWSSNESDVISNEGIVTRGLVDQQVILTATLSLGGQTREKTFEITVLHVSPPVIEEVGATSPIRYDDFELTISVEAENDIESVVIYYRLEEGLPFLNKNMTDGDGGHYSVSFAGHEMWSLTFEYYAVAIDSSGFFGMLGEIETPIMHEIVDLDYVFEDTPDILITEIFTGGSGSANNAEFFEIYNNSLVQQNLMDLNFYYVGRLYAGTLSDPVFDLQYSARSLDFGELDELILEPGEVMVVSNNLTPTSVVDELEGLAFFNSYFNTDLVLYENFIFMTSTTNVPGNNANGGMNSRGWAVMNSDNELISQSFFHLHPDGRNFETNLTGSLPVEGFNSIQYGFPQMTIELDLNDPKRPFNSMISADQYLANPGEVLANQVPLMPEFEAPELNVFEESVELYLLLDQTTVNLNEVFGNLYETFPKGFPFIVTYDVKLDGATVEIEDNEIAAISGVYQVKILLVSPDESFVTVESSEITLTIIDVLIDPTVTIETNELETVFNLSEQETSLFELLDTMYAIDEGSYEDLTFISFKVFKDELEIPTTSGVLEVEDGVYQVIVVVNPIEDGLFTEVESAPIQLTIVIDDNLPELSNVQMNGSYDTEFTVSIEATDIEGLAVDAPVVLYYRLDNRQIPLGSVTQDYISIEMTTFNGMLFETSIPDSYAWNPSLEYYFKVVDVNGNVAYMGSEAEPLDVSILLPETDLQTAPELLVTEIYAAGRSAADPYEFFEVYNNSAQPINLMTYGFYYVSRVFSNYDTRNLQIEYGIKSVQWGELSEFYIQPGDVVVFAHNGTSGVPTTAEDMNAYFYCSELIQGVNFFNILNEDGSTLNATGTNGGGGTNSRGWAIKDSEDNLISQAYTHLNLDGSNLPKGSSLLSENGGSKTTMLYSYFQMELLNTENTDPNNRWNQMISADQFIGSPGWVFAGQVPDEYVVDPS